MNFNLNSNILKENLALHTLSKHYATRFHIMLHEASYVMTKYFKE